MTRLRFAAAVGAASLAAAAALAAPPSPVQNLLLASDGPEALRARLAAFADSARAVAYDAGEAWYFAGVSRARAGQPDSALAAFARARALRGNAEDALAAVDVELARGTSAALDGAAALLAPLLAQPAAGFADELSLRDAYVRAQRGDPAALRAAVDARRSPLSRPRASVGNRPLWAARFAPLALAAGDGEAAWRLVSPLAVATRGRDPDLSRLARAASAGRPLGAGYDAWLAAECARADTAELGAFLALGARPLAVRAEDGTALHAWLLPGPSGAAIAAVAAPAGAEAMAECDSLLVQLRRARLAIVLLEPRGVRRSASAAEPAALLRAGREEADQRRLARDLGHALTAAARATGAGTPRAVVAGAGPSAMAVALAAVTDPRVRAVLLAGAEIAPVDRGWFRASLAASGVPAYFETGPETVLENLEIDRIVAELPPAQTRVADARAPGRGAALFRAGPAEGARFAGWLSDALKRPRATPPAPPR